MEQNIRARDFSPAPPPPDETPPVRLWRGSTEREIIRTQGKGTDMLSCALNTPGPVSQRVAINRMIDINRRSMANRVSRKLAINRKPF